MKKQSQLTFLLLFSSWLTISAQSVDKIEARISYIQAINSKEIPGGTLAVSFMNNSESNIYVPEIIKFSSGKRGGFLKIYRRINNVFVPLPFYGGELPKGEGSHISGYANSIERKYSKESENVYSGIFKEIRNMPSNSKLPIDTNVLFNYLKRPLFLKSGTESRHFFTVSVDELILSSPGEYVIRFEPDDNYVYDPLWPNLILGYTLYKPKEIKSNTLYITVE